MLPKRVALITGITGQDGLYMTAHLLYLQTDYNYTVHGIVRKNSQGLQILEQLNSDKIHFHFGDVTDSLFMFKILAEMQPDEVYNFAA